METNEIKKNTFVRMPNGEYGFVKHVGDISGSTILDRVEKPGDQILFDTSSLTVLSQNEEAEAMKRLKKKKKKQEQIRLENKLRKLERLVFHAAYFHILPRYPHLENAHDGNVVDIVEAGMFLDLNMPDQ